MGWIPLDFQVLELPEPRDSHCSFLCSKTSRIGIYAPATLALEIVFYPGVFIAAAWLYYNMVEKALAIPNDAAALGVLALLAPVAVFVPGFLLAAADPLARAVARESPLDRVDAVLVTLGLAFGASFFVTMAALYFGTVVTPNSAYLRTGQLFISNVVFDGITLLATIAILRRIGSNASGSSVFIAVIADISLCAVFACLSLWLGLLVTPDEHSLSSTCVSSFS